VSEPWSGFEPDALVWSEALGPVPGQKGGGMEHEEIRLMEWTAWWTARRAVASALVQGWCIPPLGRPILAVTEAEPFGLL